MKKYIFTTILSVFFAHQSGAQVLSHKENFTKQDTLRGSNTEFRNWWDVKHYDLSIEPDYDTRFIKGVNKIEFSAEKNRTSDVLQIDLQEPMKITSVLLNGVKVNEYERDGNVYFLTIGKLVKEKKNILEIAFEGKPRVAVRPPWDGGWIFAKDNEGRPWMSVAVQGLGASAWFPNKDYQGDEPDNGADLEIIVPKGLVGIGNGRKVSAKEVGDKVAYKWRVVNPINNYNIIPYIGYYQNFKDEFKGSDGKLDLDYYVLDYNLDKAKKQFDQNKKMLACFEDWFGPYPFYKDSFKMIESPHLGMEHQSGIAYGNQFMNGYLGNDLSGTGYGLKWDFIIIHESGHEWFGNNITAKDVADMWVHESFTSYSETLYTECQQGKKAADLYNIGNRQNIQNDIPIVGPYGVNQEGSGDMYSKGANMLHTFRTWLNDDVKFKNILRGLNKDFYHQTVTGEQVEIYLAKKSGLDLTSFFNQYLRSTKIPTLEMKLNNQTLSYRYTNIVDGFNMPLRLENNQTILPTKDWQVFDGKLKDFKVLPTYYIFYNELM